MKRRQFFQAAAASSLLLGSDPGGCLGRLVAFESPANLSHIEARFYKKHPDREIECQLCPRNCKLGDKERGYCGVRENEGGTYYTLVYGKAVAVNVDPIEKKPFFHFLPSSSALSIATAGCNVNCKFCQNWQISQVRAEQVEAFDLPPVEVVANARKYRCPVIAYTYTEPVVFYEYMYDTAVAARRDGIKNCVVTGGHISAEPLAQLIKAVDAIKIDLKGFNQGFYTNYVRGELKPVLEAIQAVRRSGVWLEIVYLVIPTLNDNSEDIRRMSQWLLKEIGPDVPLHFSRFQPMYLVKNLPPTPVSTLESVHQIAKSEGLRYVYIGNVPGHPAENTYCPKCRKMIVERFGFEVRAVNLDKGNCRFCRNPIPGIWA
jgi:pyruvate formate lyase activating enzyme